MLVRDKHSSVLGPFISYAKNKVLWMHTQILDEGRENTRQIIIGSSFTTYLMIILRSYIGVVLTK